ncbi:MAG: lipid A deacylase LpxR family protein [Rhodobacteraceae bacterium]|nr:MAG: lipid A deacylase LpxR family protein [Paracoccaceae bacterium]
MTRLPSFAPLLMLAAGAAAAGDAAAPSRARGLLTLQIENDVFAGIDEQYTNGTYLSYALPRNELPGWARWTRRQLLGVVEADDWQVVYGVGQSMFTPSDITIPDPPQDERPYAGFLFGSAYLSADTGRRLDTVGVDVGVTGPPSLAETTQKFIHNDLGIGDTPRGWGTQLETEVAFRVVYEQKRKYGTQLGPGFWGLEVDAIPHVAVALGTVDTSLSGALTVRAGRGLDIDYGMPRVRRSVAPMARENTTGRTRWNVFAGAGGRLVGRDLFLDGNTFRDSRSVDKEPFVADANLGATVDFGPVIVSYMHVFRSPDFETLDDWSQFGALVLRAPF